MQRNEQQDPEVENFVLMVMLQVQWINVKRIREVIVTFKPHNAEQQTVAQLANKTSKRQFQLSLYVNRKVFWWFEDSILSTST